MWKRIKSVSTPASLTSLIDKYLQDTLSQFDFSPSNIVRIEALLLKYGGEELIDPHNSRNDSNIGSFMAFILRDACEFSTIVKSRAGFNVSKRRELLNYKKDALGEEMLKVGQLQGHFC
jgi:hypothetical protein